MGHSSSSNVRLQSPATIALADFAEPSHLYSGKVLFHPNFVLRVAAEPAAIVRQIATGAAVAAFERCVAADSRAAALVSPICDRLFAVYSEVSCKQVQSGILQIKRDLYNMRDVPRDRAAMLLRGVSESLAAEVDAALIAVHSLHMSRIELESAYHAEMAESRAALRRKSARGA